MKLNLNLIKGGIYKEIKKINKNVLIIIGIAIIIILAFLLRELTKKKDYNIAENIYNGGIVATNGKTIYYYNVDDSSIYKKKINSTKKKKIIEASAVYINAYDGYIYYIEPNEQHYDLVKVKENGQDKQTVIENVDNKMMTVANKNIYYFKDENLHRIKVNGKDNIKISEKSIINYQVVKNWIFYIYNDGEQNVLAKMTTTGEKNVKLRKGVAENFLVTNKKVYYISQEYNSERYRYEYVLCRTDKSGKKTTEVCDLPSEIQSVNITDTAIYYSETDDYEEYSVNEHRYKKGKQTLTKTIINPKINIVDDWMFYIDVTEDGNKVNRQISIK